MFTRVYGIWYIIDYLFGQLLLFTAEIDTQFAS